MKTPFIYFLLGWFHEFNMIEVKCNSIADRFTCTYCFNITYNPFASSLNSAGGSGHIVQRIVCQTDKNKPYKQCSDKIVNNQNNIIPHETRHIPPVQEPKACIQES